ncbi:hypothetical protein ACP4OV_004416 [Aristida adscensionis]
MADDNVSLGKAIAVVAAGAVSMSLAVGASFWAMEAYSSGRLGRGWRWLRGAALGGVTTLERALSYSCAMCQYSLDAGEEVRVLSCGHVFHCRESDKCRDGIDGWLRRERMVCPICRRTPLPVFPWRARPPLKLAPSPAPSPPAEPSLCMPSPGSEEPPSPPPSPVLEEPLLPES